uniref:Uncharacterized protein n=1 Tax=Triticum urartu TaxID=4572 RepID=A0A8R7QYB6_TRIUA
RARTWVNIVSPSSLVIIDPQTHSSGPPTRDLPVLTPILVLSLRVPLCCQQKNQWLASSSTTTTLFPGRPFPLANSLCLAASRYVPTQPATLSRSTTMPLVTRSGLEA